MLDVAINKIIPRLNIAFRQARITQSSNQQSLNYNKTSPDCHQPRSVSPNGGNIYIMNILTQYLVGWWSELRDKIFRNVGREGERDGSRS